MTARSDARRNRERLVAAAEEVFGVHGPHVALQKVAHAAGVGRGTLYRHFPHRAALILAVFERRVAELEAAIEVAPRDPHIAARLLRATLDQQQRTPGMTRWVLDSREHVHALELLVERIEHVLAEPVAAARDAGVFQADVRPRDLLTAWAMFEGVTSTVSHTHDEDRVERARHLIERSLLTSPHHRDVTSVL